MDVVMCVVISSNCSRGGSTFQPNFHRAIFFVATLLLGLLTPSYAAGPCAIAVTKEGRTAFIAAGRSRELLAVDLLAGKV